MRNPFLPVLGLCLLAVPGFAQDKDKTPPKDQAPAKKGVDFATQIWPILEKSCVECHTTAHTGADGKLKKPKGGVVLDSKDGITGSKKGKLFVAKKPDESLVYQSISLPADDEDRMPPAKKGGPLPAEQQELIKKWIEDGAEFGNWAGKKAEEKPKDKDGDKGKDKPSTPPGGDKPKGKDVDPLVQLQKGVKPLAANVLEAFASGPFA
jgi:Planctomycete cytochrome C